MEQSKFKIPTQIGGDHYEKLNISPWNYFIANNPYEVIKGVCIFNILKYISRDKDNNLQDLQKAQWYLNELIRLTQDNKDL